jgi:hypothetical protein
MRWDVGEVNYSVFIHIPVNICQSRLGNGTEQPHQQQNWYPSPSKQPIHAVSHRSFFFLL